MQYLLCAMVECYNKRTVHSKGVRKGGVNPHLSLVFYKNFIIRAEEIVFV